MRCGWDGDQQRYAVLERAKNMNIARFKLVDYPVSLRRTASRACRMPNIAHHRDACELRDPGTHQACQQAILIREEVDLPFWKYGACISNTSPSSLSCPSCRHSLCPSPSPCS